MSALFPLLYLIASVLFILSLRGLSSPKTSRQGNFYGIAGMAIAVGATLLTPGMQDYALMIVAIAIGGSVGVFIARRIAMTSLPQLVAAFHSLVGMAAVLVAAATFYQPEVLLSLEDGAIPLANALEMGLGLAIGAMTFTGSIVAFGKLQGIIGSAPISFSGQHLLNAALGVAIVAGVIWFALEQTMPAFWITVALALLLGYLLIIPIGGADMPVIVSMLNSYSGWAACGIGFSINNTTLIVVGALVGSSGAILSYIMCKGMNRSIINVVLGGFGGESSSPTASAGADDRPVQAGSPEDAAFMMENAESVIIVPGYGMAVAQAQHGLSEIAELLKAKGVQVRYAIHPVAGRMPGHMNVLLAEAGVPYEDVLELEEINRDFASTDVAFVIGANDVTNPSAKTDKQSPIYGMPILDVADARNVYFIKRSMASGYAGVQNELFFQPNTTMLFGDAKKVCEAILKHLE